MINKRIMKIIDILLDQDSYITIDRISELLSVSNKTIRNDLQLVDEWLAGKQLRLVKKTGIGIKIDSPHSQKLRLLADVRQKNQTVIEHTPAARKLFIGMQLATFDSCRIYELSEQLYVSRATIHKDLLALDQDLKAFHITLHRKNNNGISIEGKEKNIRNFLLKLMLSDNGYQRFIEIVQNDAYVCDGSYVFAGLEATDDEVKDFVDCILRSNNPYIASLNFHSLILICLRAYAAYLRIAEKHTVSLSDAFIEELQNEPFHREAQELADRLSNHYRLPFPKAEVYYLQVYFLALQSTDAISEADQGEAAALTEQLLASWSAQLNLPFCEDDELRQAIFTHLCPSIIRFRHDIPNENPLMPEIHELYRHTLSVVKNSISCIEEHFHCHVSEDEISYLALHLATSLERMKQPLRTVLVTHGSAAAASLLKRKLSASISEIDIIAQETFLSVYQCDLSGVELIISTISLSLKSPLPVLVINPLLHSYDVLRLKDIISTYYKQKNDPDKRKTALFKQG